MKLGVSILGSLAVLVSASSEHSNTCVQNLGGILPCSDIGLDGGIFSFFQNFGLCCDGLRQIALDKCECNPFVADGLLGEEGSQLFDLELVCRILQPLNWIFVPWRFFRTCDDVRSVFDYGCDVPDVQIDAERYESLSIFNALFVDTDADESTSCFDTPAFLAGLAEAMVPDAELYVPYGGGYYKGVEDITEYLAIPFNALTHGFWQRNPERAGPDKPAGLALDEADGLTWYIGSTNLAGTYLRYTDPFPEYYVELEILFGECETKVRRYNVLPTVGLAESLITRFAQTAQFSKRYGIEDICRYHTEYCSGDPATSQYDTEDDCLEFMRSLPLWTEACGRNRAFVGLSLGCKWKHHLMIPTNPPLHCPHIGLPGSADVNGALKCNDEVECVGNDEGQDLWPPLLEIGDETPAERIAVYEQNNIGWEDEPFGCAIPANTE